jgi:hypothetical protein
MYSSLLKIDIVAKAPEGPLYVQTDHRRRDEIEAEPEISVLFALVRVLNARAHAKAEGEPATVVYACMDDAPPFLVDALAAAGAELETQGGTTPRRKLSPTGVTPGEIADRAFADLVKRVQARIGLTDLAGTLRALEAEILVDPPVEDDAEDGGITYWTRVLELAAVTGELLRARGGGRWIEAERADIPFGFETGGRITLATNRASRFIADGEGESMFHLLRMDDEVNRDDLPILPSLRALSEAKGANLVYKPLLERGGDDLPVIAYGTDSPNTFGLMTKDGAKDDVETVHVKAIENLRAQEVEVQAFDVADVPLIAVTGSFFATEKVLDREFMQGLHAKLGEEMLAVTMPRRGLMFVTSAVGKPDPVKAMTVLSLITRKESENTRSISTAILLVQNGEPVGHVQLTGGDGDGDDEPEAPPPPKKPGFFRRLFGGS